MAARRSRSSTRRRLVDEGYEEAKRILLENNEGFERLARGLLEYETLTGDEIRKVIAGEQLDRSDDAAPPPLLPGGGHSAIPKAGKPRRTDPDTGGMAPQPQ